MNVYGSACMLETGRSSWRATGVAIMATICAAVVLAGCGSSGDQSSTTGTTAAGRRSASATTGKSAPSKPSAHTGAAASSARPKTSDAWRKGHKIGQQACAEVSHDDALAHFLASAKAAEKQHHVAARAGMIARIQQLPESAYQGAAAPAMAAALYATGLPVERRAGAFAGCVAALGGTDSE